MEIGDSKVEFPFEKNVNRCIGCAYLGWSDENGELKWDSRWEIINYKWISANYQYLRCYKGLKTPRELEDTVHNAVCPAKGWKPYREGVDPERAYNWEREQRHFNWIKTAAIASIVGVAVILILYFFASCSCS